MKTLLIYPYFLEDRVHVEEIAAVPIGVYYIGAMLREHGHEVEVLNWHDILRTPHVIRETLAREKPRLIGFSVVHANRWGAIDIARLAKELDPSVTIAFGGPGATFLWEHLLTHFSEVDVVVIGEGEHPFLELTEAVERGQSPSGIQGIALRRDGRPALTRPRAFIRNPDDLPNPARHFTFYHVSSSRGCPWNCAFCGSPEFWGRKVRFHSPAYFVEQLELLHARGVKFFLFSDDTFTRQRERVIDICRRIIHKRLDIAWAAIARVDDPDEEMLLWMRKAGCIQISYGVESGSKAVRAALNKNLDARRIREAFYLTQRCGILARAYFIYGCPGETPETIRQTLDLIAEIKPLAAIFYILDVFPGTALCRDYKKRTGATDDIWLNRMEDIMYWETDPRLSREQVLAFGEELRSTFHRGLPSYAEAVELADRADLYPMHADFLSRLAMTFTHGDYAAVEAIPDKEPTAARLYERALAYHPDHRAYLGLAILKQKAGAHQDAVALLGRGTRAYPGSEQLHLCLAVSCMNLSRYAEAIQILEKFPGSSQALRFAAACHEALGDRRAATAILNKLQDP